MKRKTVIIILAVLIVTIVGCVMAVLGGGFSPDLGSPSVTFDVSKWNGAEDSEQAFIISSIPYDDNNETMDILPEMRSLLPGESTETRLDVEVTGFTPKTDTVKLYLTAEWNSDFNNGYLKPGEMEIDEVNGEQAPAYNEDYAQLMNGFMGMISVKTADGNVNTGMLEATGNSESDETASLIPEGTVLLGEFDADDAISVKVCFDLDENAGDQYEGLMSELGWKFTAEVSNKMAEMPDGPQPELNTEDHYAYIVGYPDGTVCPNAGITRAEAVTIFFRLLTEDTRNAYLSESNSFSDVSEEDWFNNAVSTLTNAGIISGYPDGTFQPNNPISRAEMAKIIALFAKLDKEGGEFVDIEDHWAVQYIRLAAGNEWINGYPDGTFGPDQQITRAETVTMINRVLMRVPEHAGRLLPVDQMQIYPDNIAEEWYYSAIQEATNSHNYVRVDGSSASDEQWTGLRDNYDWASLEK